MYDLDFLLNIFTETVLVLTWQADRLASVEYFTNLDSLNDGKRPTSKTLSVRLYYQRWIAEDHMTVKMREIVPR